MIINRNRGLPLFLFAKFQFYELGYQDQTLLFGNYSELHIYFKIVHYLSVQIIELKLI